MSSYVKMIHMVFSCLMMMLIVGCNTAGKNPIGMSMADLSGESRNYKKMYFPFPNPFRPLVDYTELFSINGSIMMPRAGMWAYYPAGGKTPAYMIGISTSLSQPTSRLIMESKATLTEQDIIAIKKAFEEAQAASNTAVQIQFELALAKIRQTNPQTKLSESEYSQKLSDIQKNLIDAEDELQTAIAKARDAANKPGIVIARWANKNEHGGTGSLGQFASLSGNKNKQTSGFVILGQVRASMLIFGEDMRMYVQAMDESEQSMFQLIGISSYILEARYVAYTSALNIEEALMASLDVELKNLTSSAKFLASIDRVKIAMYYTSLSSLENSGMIGPVEWDQKDSPLVKYRCLTAQEMRDAELDQTLQRHGQNWVQVTSVPMQLADKTTDPQPGFQAVYAVPTKTPSIFKTWQRKSTSKPIKRGDRWYALIDHKTRSPVTCTCGQ